MAPVCLICLSAFPWLWLHPCNYASTRANPISIASDAMIEVDCLNVVRALENTWALAVDNFCNRLYTN